MENSSHLKKLTLFILLLSPGFWQLLFHPLSAISTWISLPSSIVTNVENKLHTQYIVNTTELRWGGRIYHRNDMLSKAIYSKAHVLTNETFDYLQFLSPRMFFAVGDGSQFTPARIEPIPFIFIAPFVIGLIYLLRQKKYKVLIILFLSPLPAFLGGHKNLSLLFPTLVLFAYVISYGLAYFRFRYRSKFVLYLSVTYAIYVCLMNIWFNFMK